MKIISVSKKNNKLMTISNFVPVILEYETSEARISSNTLSKCELILEMINYSYFSFIFLRIHDDTNIYNDLKEQFYLTIHKDEEVVTKEMILNHNKEIIRIRRNDKINEILNNNK